VVTELPRQKITAKLLDAGCLTQEHVRMNETITTPYKTAATGFKKSDCAVEWFMMEKYYTSAEAFLKKRFAGYILSVAAAGLF
jgi:hypothetical protein